MLPDNPNGSPQGSTLLGNSLLWVAPLIALLIGWIGKSMGGLELAAALTLAIAIWTALWWIFEAVPIPVASLIPLAFLPMFGVLSPQTVGEKYGHPLVLLLLGGFLLSKAMEKSGAHRRIAIAMVRTFPASDKFLVLGFMGATAFLSMWISNTACTLMMLPMALAVIQGSENKKLTIPLLLGIAFAANIGGIGTPIGTPPNLVMMGAYKDLGFPELSFSDWMTFGMPVTLVMTLVIWLWLTRKVSGKGVVSLPHPGSWSKPEIRTLTIFSLTALAWITRSEPFGGWKTWLDLPQANDASVAFIACSHSSFCLAQWREKGRAFARLENRQPDSLGYAHSGGCWSLPGGSIQTVRPEPIHCLRPIRSGEPAYNWRVSRNLFTRHFPHRDDLQYRNH